MSVAEAVLSCGVKQFRATPRKAYTRGEYDVDGIESCDVVSRNSVQLRDRRTRGVSEAVGNGRCEDLQEDWGEFRSARGECALHRADHWPARV
jgi:hypothetical protein